MPIYPSNNRIIFCFRLKNLLEYQRIITDWLSEGYDRLLLYLFPPYHPIKIRVFHHKVKQNPIYFSTSYPHRRSRRYETMLHSPPNRKTMSDYIRRYHTVHQIGGLVYTALDLSTMLTELLALSQGYEYQWVMLSYKLPYTLYCRNFLKIVG